jgi:hypothetical protein
MPHDLQPAAVFSATYHNLKNVPSRSVVQIVFEIPVEQADRAYQVLGGLPNPARPSWFAIARLVEGGVAPEDLLQIAAPSAIPEALPPPIPEPPPALSQAVASDEKDRRDWWELPPATRAAMLCQKERFQGWLHRIGRIPAATEDEAVAYVRRVAGGSRGNLGKAGFEDRTAAWDIIDRKYHEHLDDLRYGGAKKGG